jgi:hypothetical protein
MLDAIIGICIGVAFGLLLTSFASSNNHKVRKRD